MKTQVLMIAKTFPKGHINAGEPTKFNEKILRGHKLHTIRPNFEYWVKRLNPPDRFLDLRNWTGKPYHSPQATFKILFPDEYNVYKLYMDVKTKTTFISTTNQGLVTHFSIDLEILSKNDGLSKEQFISWFEQYPKQKEFALIMFNAFTYL